MKRRGRSESRPNRSVPAIQMNSGFEELENLFKSNGVKYPVVGGYAVDALHRTSLHKGVGQVINLRPIVNRPALSEPRKTAGRVGYYLGPRMREMDA